MSPTAQMKAHEQIITNLLKELERAGALTPDGLDAVMIASKEVFEPQARSRDAILQAIQKIWDDVKSEC